MIPITPSLGENVLLSEIAKELDSQSGFNLPVYDTLVESSTTVFTNGGTLSFFQGGPSGTKVAELTITVAGGARTTQRTA